jgi:uncharacterized protein
MAIAHQRPEVYSICSRCSRIRKTCCQISEVFVTQGDIDRIKEYTGIEEKLDEFKYPSDPAYLDQEDDPVWAAHVFQPDKTRRVLIRKEDGDCRFLHDDGCELPMEIRPIICRLYPHNYNAEGFTGVTNRCPSELLDPGVDILDALDLRDMSGPIRWRNTLYQEIIDESKR